MKSNNHKIIWFALILIVALLILVYFVFPNFDQKSYGGPIGSVVGAVEELVETEKEEKKNVKHIATPESVRAIYMTACVAGTKNFRDDLIKLIDETELNSVIIDVKDFSGTISFPSSNPKLLGVNGSGCKADDMGALLAELKAKNIYTIARVTVFQDAYYTKIRPDLAVQKKSDGGVWKDHKGISFIEAGAKEYWDYIIELAKESHELGFDEINFDYVRFPSDGNLKDMAFPFSQKIVDADPKWGKSIVVENFFKYLHDNLKDTGMVTSADLFGMVTTNSDDLGIGQVLEKALPYFDYIAPMVYPSHYYDGFNGWKDPNVVPYELIHYVMSAGVKKVETLDSATTTPESIKEKVSVDQLRPWLQDFDYGGNYGPKEVRAQIQATYDAGLDSWMLWAPSNRYTREALE